MRRHPRIGHEMLSDSQSRFIQMGATDRAAPSRALRRQRLSRRPGRRGDSAGGAHRRRGRRVRRADLAAPVQAKPGRWTRRSAYLHAQRGRPVRSRAAWTSCCATATALDEICARYLHRRQRPGTGSLMRAPLRPHSGSACRTAPTASTARRWCGWRSCRWCWSTCCCVARFATSREPDLPDRAADGRIGFAVGLLHRLRSSRGRACRTCGASIGMVVGLRR